MFSGRNTKWVHQVRCPLRPTEVASERTNERAKEQNKKKPLFVRHSNDDDDYWNRILQPTWIEKEEEDVLWKQSTLTSARWWRQWQCWLIFNLILIPCTQVPQILRSSFLSQHASSDGGLNWMPTNLISIITTNAQRKMAEAAAAVETSPIFANRLREEP